MWRTYAWVCLAALATSGSLSGCVGPLRRPYMPWQGTATYEVQRGDTLYAIARRCGTRPARLAALNQLTEPYTLRPGMRLQLPQPQLRSTDAAAPLPEQQPRPAAPAAPQRSLAWPLQGVLTSAFGRRAGHSHDGIDIGAPQGTPVLAAAGGEVVFASRHGGYGNVVIVRHADSLVTVYAHHEVNLVRAGQQVQRGETIAKVGATGRATGPHLHFEVRQGTRPQNPLLFLPL